MIILIIIFNKNCIFSILKTKFINRFICTRYQISYSQCTTYVLAMVTDSNCDEDESEEGNCRKKDKNHVDIIK